MSSSSKPRYSIELCRRLRGIVRDQDMLLAYRPDRYEEGDSLEYECTGVWPQTPFRAGFRVEKFVGGGFAGQVYLCTVQSVKGDVSRVPGMEIGARVAVKVMVPPGAFARRFRDALYAVGFQSPFSAQVNRAACRAGLLWQRLAGMAARQAFGREGAVAEVYASFFDPALRSFGEVREWVEGRTWRLEPDTRLGLRRGWRTVRPEDTGSPEYIAKRQFMAKFVGLLRQMGAHELARQYEWWTMKSQPNVLKRAGSDMRPDSGLCAVDFRAGLVLLPFLPMSPADVALIVRGLARGSAVQFDRFDPAALTRFVEARRHEMPGGGEIARALIEYDGEYRRSMPDITRQGWRLLADSGLRRDVRSGLASAHGVLEGLDGPFVESMRDRPFRFAAFVALGAVPFAGRAARKAWGSTMWRRHARMVLTSPGYFRRFARAGMVRCLQRWHRSGRTGETRTIHLLDRPVLFWAQRLTIGLLPPGLHRVIAEPSYALRRVAEWYRFVRAFCGDAAFRAAWLRDAVEEGRREGALDEAEYRHIIAEVDDPFIAKYLKFLGVHFATLPLSEIFWTIVGGGVVLWALLHGQDWKPALERLAAFALLMPFSPGSLVRAGFVLWIMIRERNFREYMVAGPFSMLKIAGYLAFPMQMATSHPALSRFMASRWATDAVHNLPVFGERGALLEHFVFDWFYNRPRMMGVWARTRMKKLLDLWMLFGVVVLALAFLWLRVPPLSNTGINSIVGVVVLCVLPRLLFYPVLSRRSKEPAVHEGPRG